MREIMFKAKTTVKEVGEFNNVWVEGDLITSNGKHYIHPNNNAVSVSGELGKIIVMHEIDPETISQYIGLCDKNGRKIWENDIVTKNNRFGKVVYGEKNCECCNGVYGWTFEHIGRYSTVVDIREQNTVEVVGNIFDNEEFLNISDEVE